MLPSKPVAVFSVIKLIPISIDRRQTLPDDCPTYFDRETRLLEAPMVIRVADQVSYISPFVVVVVVVVVLNKRFTSLLRLLTLICDSRFELSSELAFYYLYEVS